MAGKPEREQGSHMTATTQKLSIRLLRGSVEPPDAVRDGVDLTDWPQLEGSKIDLGTMGGNTPKWAKLLNLSESEKARVYNNTAFGLLFLKASDRWFVLSFGMGHVRLDPAKIEQDFGLKVVLNTVDPKQLKSADVRTPDENTLSRRSQTSRGSDQTAFAIDIERDIVRGLAGSPKDTVFGSRVAGSDALALDRKVELADLPTVCAQAYAHYQKTDYKTDFGWIDQIQHVRDESLIAALDDLLAAVVDAALKGTPPNHLHLAYPVIYDPERATYIRYKGFRSRDVFPDLHLAGYLGELAEHGASCYASSDLQNHKVHEVDDQGKDRGEIWKVRDCFVFETEFNAETYVLSGGRWYKLSKDLVTEVEAFFQRATLTTLPAALAHENEETYNQRIGALGGDLLCLDRRLIKPPGASSPIEACDFLGHDSRIIHVKDRTSSSRLSHLFAQGTVSARVLKMEGAARDQLRSAIATVEGATGAAGFQALVPASADPFHAGTFTVVYAVLVDNEQPQLPFFSLISFRQAARELEALGYQYAFAWIKKAAPPAAKPTKAKPKKSSTGS
jgi:uncharacterized protein (TIGR04141 family)